MRRTGHRRRTLVNITVKKLTVGDIVGLLCSFHSCSCLLNAFENQTHWRRNKRNTAATSQPNFQNRCDGTEFQQRLFVPPCYGTLGLLHFSTVFAFTTWYTQQGVLEVTGERHCASRKLICGAYWTDWWASQAAGSILDEMEADDRIMVMEREAPQAKSEQEQWL